MESIYFSIGFGILFWLLAIFASRRFIHLLQLEGYQGDCYIKSTSRNFLHLWLPLIVIYCGAIILNILLDVLIGAATSAWIMDAVFLIASVIYTILTNIKKAKKPLVMTQRIWRLIACTAIVLLIAIGLLAYASNIIASKSIPGIIILKAIQYLPLPLLPLLVLLASLTMLPIENGIRKWYYNNARKKIDSMTSLKKIGITGSYGKTSTKFILGTLLSEKYKVLVPPSSYNTPMGLTRMIREQLDDTYDVFIAEMGARRVGEIKELCDLVHPQYGIITSVGKQHLETFKTLENITKTKYELIEALPRDGMAFFPSDNDICFELYMATRKPKALYGLTERGEPLYMTAGDVTVGPEGSSFQLISAEGSIPCTTKLLGKHSISNILGCAAVAHALGLTLGEIASGISKLEPVEHRLQIIPTQNGITVIDDAFNSNPAGSKAALDVLAAFTGRRKVIITPGMVELGEEEEEQNKIFGTRMANVADYVILVGRKHTRPIAEGLESHGFAKEHIYIAEDLNEATRHFASMNRIGDVVLFENDLTDNYNDK